jgi:hypothetical protein
MYKKYFFLTGLFLCVAASLHAQSDTKKLIQLSGIIVTGDSLSPVPYTGIMIKSSNRGTISDYYGFFSIVGQLGDEIEFSALGFKKTIYKISDSLTENRYSLIQILNRDTVLLNQAIIYPWPTKEQFKQAFLDLKIPDDDMTHARRNLALETMHEERDRMDMDGSLNGKYQMQQRQSKLYNNGQLPSNNLLNPVAWAKFIQAWKNGDFKSKDKE